jgi:ATP-dependent helicase STH1/SNF2
MEGRDHGKRNVVSYNDGLGDDAWAVALESEEDLQDVIEKSRERAARRTQNKLMHDSEGVSSRNSPATGLGAEEKPGRKVARRRTQMCTCSGSRVRRWMTLTGQRMVRGSVRGSR